MMVTPQLRIMVHSNSTIHSKSILILLLLLNWTFAYHVMFPPRHNGVNIDGKSEDPTRNHISMNSISGHQFPHTDADGNINSFTQSILESISERTKFANSEEEIREHKNRENYLDIGLMRKRSEKVELHSGGCVAHESWLDMGDDHYPRYISSFNCTSVICDRGHGACQPKLYPLLVLSRNSANNTSLMACDPILPEKLRCDWKLKTVTITTYCQCSASGMSLFHE